MFTMKFGSKKESTSPFADFIRNAKSEEKNAFTAKSSRKQQKNRIK